MENERGKPQDRSHGQSAKCTDLRAGVEGELWGLVPGSLPAEVSTEALSRGIPQAAISGPGILGEFPSGRHRDVAVWQPSSVNLFHFSAVSWKVALPCQKPLCLSLP